MLTHITSTYNHRDGFDDFPKISDHFPSISENSPNVVLSETTEQDLKMFQSYMHQQIWAAEYRVKHDINDNVIDIVRAK